MSDKSIDHRVSEASDHETGGRDGRWQWIALAAGASGGVLAALVAWVGPAALWARLAQMHPGYLCAALGIYVGAHLIRTLRLGVLIPATRSAAGLSVVTMHSFANQVLPARTGEVTFPALLAKLFDASVGRGASYLVVIRFAELTALFAWQALAVSVWWVQRQGGGVQTLYIAAGIIGVGALLFVVSRPMLRACIAVVRNVLAADLLPDWRLIQYCRDAIPDAEQALNEVTDTQWRSLIAWSLAMWGAMFSVFAACLSAAGIDLGFARTIVGAAGGIIGNLLSIVGFGSLGMMEAGWTAAYVAVGAAAVPVAAAGFAVHAIVIGGSALLAGISVAIDRLNIGSDSA